MSSLKYICLTILIFCLTFTLFSFSDNDQVLSNCLTPSYTECFSDTIYRDTEVQSSLSRYGTEYSSESHYNGRIVLPSSDAPMTTFSSYYDKDIPVGIPTNSTEKCYKTMPTSPSVSPLPNTESQLSSNTTNQPTIISTTTPSINITTFNIPNSSEGPLIISL